MKILGHMLATMRNRTGSSAGGTWDHNHHASHQWCVRNYYYFYILVRCEDAVMLSPKVSDKNGRENETKPRWLWSGRHNENGMGCGKRKWWGQVLWWGGNFPTLLFGIMDLMLAGLSVKLVGDWGVQTPWKL